MSRPRERVRLEAGPKLDLNGLLRRERLKTGETGRGPISWSSYGEVVLAGSFEICLPLDAGGWFALKAGSLDQRIELNRVPRHFGGAQWYFACPVTGKRVSVLWLPPGARRFQSRQSWGRQVAYGSQFEAWHDRALSRAQDIRYQLAGKDYLSVIDGVPPPKPKGMHRLTYEAKIKRLRRCESVCFQYEMSLSGRLAQMNLPTDFD